MMVGFTTLIVLSTCATPFVGEHNWLLWPVVSIWGASGGALYTLAMIDIGTREQGITLVNSTAVLVLTYTLGGLAASAASGALIERSLTTGFPALLISVGCLGLLSLLISRRA